MLGTRFLCPFDVEEGEDEGVPASEVRLDEVLTEVHDELLYVYDYGDDWELRIRLESVVDRGLDDEPALCTGGRRGLGPGSVSSHDRGLLDTSVVVSLGGLTDATGLPTRCFVSAIT